MKLTKKLLKELSQEGITKEMVENHEGISPAQLMRDEEPVSLIQCSTGYWVKTEDGFLKDENDKLMVINEIDAKVGRARYILNFQEEITEKKIQAEIEILKKATKKIVEKYLSDIKRILQLAGILNEEGLGIILQKRAWEENGILEEKIKEAKEIAMQENYVYSYEKIKEWYEKEEYDTLYQYFFQDGLPQIASYDILDLEGLAKHFHADKLQNTINSIESHNHLYNVAKFRVG